MRSLVYIIAILSYVVTQILRLIQFHEHLALFAVSVASVVVFATASYFTWKKVRFFRFITSGYLAFAGFFMLSLYISPVIDSVALRIFYVLMGLFWLASSIWILKEYSVK